jgi:hypothetical protein
MKNLFIALAAMVAVGCSKPGYDPADDPKVQALIGTEWGFVEENISAIHIKFISTKQAFLTKTRWEFRPETIYDPEWYEEFGSVYFYDYFFTSDGEIQMSVSEISNWTLNDGRDFIIPSDYKDMPQLIGYISGESMSLQKTDGTTYATLEHKK